MAHILIVDDENTIMKMLVAWFLEKGHTVMEAPDGNIAERMIFTNAFDLIITDIVMPEMNGIDLLKRVKFVNPHIKFIVMTGFHKPENIPLCLEHNISRYIRKPFHMEHIDRMVEEVIGEKETERVKVANQVADGWLEMDLYSSEESLMLVHNCMEQYLYGYFPLQAINKTLWAFYEIVRNAMEWGNSLVKDRIVHVSCMVLSDRVLFKIQDHGKGFDVMKAFKQIEDPFERLTRRENEGKRPGGYGIDITRKYMDDVFYNEKGNCVVMTKMISKTIQSQPKEFVT